MINYDLTKIKALVFDVDGVLSASTINVDTNGDFLRTTNVKDGYAMHLAVKMGFHIAIITGGGEESIALRYGRIGMEDIYLSSSNIFTTKITFKNSANLIYPRHCNR